jgi:hypothetical protein
MTKSGKWTITVLTGGERTPVSTPTEFTFSCRYELELPQLRVEFSYPSGAQHGIPHSIPDIPGTLTIGPFVPAEMEQWSHFSGKVCRATGPEHVIFDWDAAIQDAPHEEGKLILTGNFLRFQ